MNVFLVKQQYIKDPAEDSFQQVNEAYYTFFNVM